MPAAASASSSAVRSSGPAPGWSQPELAALLPSRMYPKWLATYAHDTPQCTPARLVEICRALEVCPLRLLARAEQHTAIDLHVDLHSVLADAR